MEDITPQPCRQPGCREYGLYPIRITLRTQDAFDTPSKVAEYHYCVAHFESAFERAASIAGRGSEAVFSREVHIQVSVRNPDLEELKASVHWLEQPEAESRFDEIGRVL